MTVFTVTICTMNRAVLLEKAVRSLFSQTSHDIPFNILVIDNNSTDATREVIADLSKISPVPLSYHLQTQPGLSHSRNYAIALCDSPHIIFLDDDATAHAGWLRAYDDLFRRYPECEAAGGPVIVQWESERPSWLRKSEECWYSAFDLGDGIRQMRMPEFPYGANMAWKIDVLRKWGGFDPNLGYAQGRNLLVPNEDVYLIYRLHREGRPVFYTSLAKVDHWISADRATPTYFYKRAYGQGIADAFMLREFFHKSGWFVYSLFVLRFFALLYAWIMKLLLRSFGNKKMAVLFQAKENFNRGFLKKVLHF